MLDFGNLEKVEKTYTKTGGGQRGQNWEGIKFRRFESTKGKKAAEEAGEQFTPFIDSNFTVSDKAFERLSLVDNGLIEYKDKDSGSVVLIVVDEEHASFMKGREFKGEKTTKGKLFSNPVMEGHLVEAGVIPQEGLVTVYLKLREEEVSNAPDYVKAAYILSVDEDGAANEALDQEVEEETGETYNTPDQEDSLEGDDENF